MKKNKRLIVYYSQTGNTKKIAELIQKHTQGDLCEIHPEIPYKSLYLGGAERVKEERKNSIHPSIEPISIDINNYDIVFLGTPNWGNGIAHPIMTFLDQYSLAGKKVFPFCTHGGGGLAHVADDIIRRCHGAFVGMSYDTHGDGGQKAQDEVLAWIKSLAI